MKRVLMAVCCAVICAAQLLWIATAAADPGAAAAEFASSYDLDPLIDTVEELVKRVESIQPAGTSGEKREQFFALKREIDEAEDAIDRLEDRLEQDYRSGALSWRDYILLERKLDRLESRLDRAENRLERTFNMDD